MNRISSIAFALVSSLAIGAAAEVAPEASQKLADFGGEPVWNSFGNASQNLLKDGGRNGGPCVDIVLGGVNSVVSGAFQICQPAPGLPSSKCLSFWIDGKAGGDRGFCVFAIDSDENVWCWNAPRWSPRAEISCAAGWRKVSCLLSDFKIEGKAKGSASSLDASKIVNLQFGVGRQLDDPSKKLCEFLLEDVAYEGAPSQASPASGNRP